MSCRALKSHRETFLGPELSFAEPTRALGGGLNAPRQTKTTFSDTLEAPEHNLNITSARLAQQKLPFFDTLKASQHNLNITSTRLAQGKGVVLAIP